MRPPVISEAEMALALGGGGQIARETACVYSIASEITSFSPEGCDA